VLANLPALKFDIKHMLRHPARGIIFAAALAVFFFGSLTATDLVAAENRPVEITGVRDFVEYWSASRLLLSGGNPYAPKELLALQQAVGWRGAAPLLMWNPPWTLSLLLPFGLLDFSLSQFVWLFTHVLAVLISVQLLWRVYGDSPNGFRLSWVLAFTFVPTIFVLILGQITPLVLVGIAAFIYLEKRKQWLAMGAVLTLTAVKPHLLYLFWVVLLLWIWEQRRWRVALGALVTGLIAAALPLGFDADVYAQYVELHSLSGIRQPFDWPAPTLGNIFLILLELKSVWWRYLPSAVGLVWLIDYWRRHRRNWRWAERLPAILLVSVVTNIFFWTYDQVILLPALVQATAWIKRANIPWHKSAAVLCYLAVNAVHCIMRFRFAEELWYVWLAPALLLNYWIFQREADASKSS
jgi:glycosyl transferase family 87